MSEKGELVLKKIKELEEALSDFLPPNMAGQTGMMFAGLKQVVAQLDVPETKKEMPQDNFLKPD